MKNKNSILSQIYKETRFKRYFQLLLGVLVLAIAYNLLILPNDIVLGGVLGVSIIFERYITIDLSTFILIVSLFLLVISYIFLGKEKTMGSIYGSILLPIFIKLTENIGDVINLNTSDQLLIALFSGLLYGIGLGLVFKAGFTTGGTDILNQIVSKYGKTSMGTAMLMTDGVIVVAGAFYFGWISFLYAVIALYIISIITDKVLLGISDAKAFYIITTKQEEISNFVINELHHSITVFDAKGGYTNSENPVLFAVIPTKEYFKFKSGIHEIDGQAFFTVVDAYEVYGGE